MGVNVVNEDEIYRHERWEDECSFIVFWRFYCWDSLRVVTATSDMCVSA